MTTTKYWVLDQNANQAQDVVAESRLDALSLAFGAKELTEYSSWVGGFDYCLQESGDNGYFYYVRNVRQAEAERRRT